MYYVWPLVERPLPYVQLHNYVCLLSILWGTRERSPPLPKIAHPSLPRLGRSQASTWPSAMHKSPPGGTACLITVSPMPGKLTCSRQPASLYRVSLVGELVGYVKECYNFLNHKRVLFNWTKGYCPPLLYM